MYQTDLQIRSLRGKKSIWIKTETVAWGWSHRLHCLTGCQTHLDDVIRCRPQSFWTGVFHTHVCFVVVTTAVIRTDKCIMLCFMLYKNDGTFTDNGDISGGIDYNGSDSVLHLCAATHLVPDRALLGDSTLHLFSLAPCQHHLQLCHGSVHQPWASTTGDCQLK